YVRAITIRSGSTVSYADAHATESGRTYIYKITAYKTVDGTTYASDYSATKTKCYLAQSTITGLTNTADGITVKWSKVAGADGYKIYRRIESGNWTLIKNITSGSRITWSNTNRISGTRYQYRVAAYKTVGGTTYIGTYSAAKTIFYLAQPVITGLSKTGSGVMVKWSKVAGADGYRIYRSGDGGASYVRAITIRSGSTVSYADAHATKKGKTYIYKIRAFKSENGTAYYSTYSKTRSITR
ncbi:MAG: hypothetical protein KBS74_02170, partial [Clostridiales bacterium]|nr:hypothetical protein [Candidatus Cacconaster stercorequi]